MFEGAPINGYHPKIIGKERPMAIEVLIRRRLSGKKKWRAYEMRIRNCRRYLAQ
jgi:hypothetical protein